MNFIQLSAKLISAKKNSETFSFTPPTTFYLLDSFISSHLRFNVEPILCNPSSYTR